MGACFWQINLQKQKCTKLWETYSESNIFVTTSSVEFVISNQITVIMKKVVKMMAYYPMILIWTDKILNTSQKF